MSNPKTKCSICGVMRETSIRRYGKFKGDVCLECEEEMEWTKTCIGISTRWILDRFPEKFAKNLGSFGELRVTPVETIV